MTDKNRLIKILKRINGNPEIGFNVLTPDGSEFWGFNESNFKSMDGGLTFALQQLRQKQAYSVKDLQRLKIPSIVSPDCDLNEVLARIDERYRVNSECETLTEPEKIFLISDVIYKDLQELTRLWRDFTSLIPNDIKDQLIAHYKLEKKNEDNY